MSGTNLRVALNGGNSFRVNLASNAAEQIRIISPSSFAFSGRITIDTTDGWNARRTYVPIKGEIVIFSDRRVVDNVNCPGIKIGDGMAYVVDLPFFGDDETNSIMSIINDHINNTAIHVSIEDRDFWNAKLNYETDGENLIFTRN